MQSRIREGNEFEKHFLDINWVRLSENVCWIVDAFDFHSPTLSNQFNALKFSRTTERWKSKDLRGECNEYSI